MEQVRNSAVRSIPATRPHRTKSEIGANSADLNDLRISTSSRRGRHRGQHQSRQQPIKSEESNNILDGAHYLISITQYDAAKKREGSLTTWPLVVRHSITRPRRQTTRQQTGQSFTSLPVDSDVALKADEQANNKSRRNPFRCDCFSSTFPKLASSSC